MSPPLPRGRARKPAGRCWTLRLAVLALAFAPVLASLWPALGRGPMLYVGEAHAAHGGRGSDHAWQPDSAGVAVEHHHEGQPHGAHADSDLPAIAIDDGEGQSGAGTAEHAGHATHCALCVLAGLALAPQFHLDAAHRTPAAFGRTLHAASVAPRANDRATRVHARAPPTLS